MPVIATNLAANSAVRYLNINSASQTSSLAKLASGSRITQASDDAADLAISTKISSDVTALNQAATNASHGISVLQTADGGASNISDILQRMKALASQSASGTVTDNERVYIDAEFQQLISEVDAISTGTRYNGRSLLDGSSDFAIEGIDVIVGSDAADTIRVALASLDAMTLGLQGVDAASSDSATGTDAIPPMPAIFTMGEAAEAFPIPPGGHVFELNGFTITIPNATASDIPMTMQTIYDALDATVTANPTVDWNISWIGGGILILSNAVGSAASLKFTQGGALIPWSLRGVLGLSGREDVGKDGSGVTAPAVLTGMSAPVGLHKALSFDINGVNVSLADGIYTAQDVADAINKAAAGVTASVVSGALTLTSNAAGASQTITLDNFVGGYPALLGFGPPAYPGAMIEVGDQTAAKDTISVLDTAIDRVSRARADIGALESRFGFHQASISTSVENLSAAISAIKDVDVAHEAARLASSKVKTQAAVAAAAQASQMPQNLLKLLQ